MDEKLIKSKGFVTIATGEEEYFILAKNLLLSYRHFNKNPFPFTIICDKENEYTALFDDVILIDNATNSYMDKLELFNPNLNLYHESIFIDADSLVFGDVSYLFELFSDQTNVSGFGFIDDKESSQTFFKASEVGKYGDMVEYSALNHGGLYFIRRNKDFLTEFYNYTQQITKEYYDYKFKFFKDPADEPIVALSMALTRCKSVNGSYCLCYCGSASRVKLDMFNGAIFHRSFSYKGTAQICHFGNARTKQQFYKNQVAILELKLKGEINLAKKLQKKHSRQENTFHFKLAIKNAWIKLKRKLFKK